MLVVGLAAHPPNPLTLREEGEVYAPFACVRGRERAERCERGMDGEGGVA